MTSPSADRCILPEAWSKVLTANRNGKRKIVLVLPERGRSGGVRCATAIANTLLERGHHVRVIYKAPRTIEAWMKSARDRILYPKESDWLDQFKGEKDVFQDISKCEFVHGEIIVAIGMEMCAELAALMSLPNPKLQYLHGSTPWLPELRQKALGLPLPKIVVASYLRDLVDTAGQGKVLAIIHNGLFREEYFSSVPESQRDGIGVIYSSHQPKDPATTLGALEKLSKLMPDVPLRVFSSDRRPRQLKCSAYRRYPSLAQAREIYSKSLVWIVASNSEGFSLPVLEAMACGCCVVATDCGGPRDIITDGENGFLVPVGDVEAIVQRVSLLLGDTALRTTMRHKAQSTVSRFTWDSCVDKLEDALSMIA